jgi:hypothetical protein
MSHLKSENIRKIINELKASEVALNNQGEYESAHKVRLVYLELSVKVLQAERTPPEAP